MPRLNGRSPAIPTFFPTTMMRGRTVARLGEIVMIHDLKRQGLTVSAIACKAGLDRKTVRKYLDRGLEAWSWPSKVERRFLFQFPAASNVIGAL